jgi:hypothetical protein
VLDLALDKPIDPELCSLHAASSLIEPQLRPLPAGFCLIALLGRIVTCMAAGPGSLSTGAARPDDPIIATAGGAGLLISHPTALRWGYHGVQFPRAVHSQTTPVGGGERKFD